MHDLSLLQEQMKLDIPQCSKCGGRGYTGCDEAHAPDGRCFIAIANYVGTPCECAAGVEFAWLQREWKAGKR